MEEASLRRKRLAEDEDDDDEEDEHRGRNKRTRAGSSAFKWLWSPPQPSTSAKASSSSLSASHGLWTYPGSDQRLSQVQHGHADHHDVRRSSSVLPMRNTHRRRGAISVTASSSPSSSASLSELDRHLALQLQQDIAVVRSKPAAGHQNMKKQRGDNNDEVEMVRRELEGVQIDATLPVILGISAELDRKLDLGTSRSS